MTETVLRHRPSHFTCHSSTASACLYVRKLEIVMGAADRYPSPLAIPSLHNFAEMVEDTFLNPLRYFHGGLDMCHAS